MNRKIREQINNLPLNFGVYLFRDEAGRLLYIGKALNLKNRVKSHFKNNDSLASISTRFAKASARQASRPLRSRVIEARSGLIGQFRQKIATIDYIKTKNETQALILEDQLIKKYQPKFNIQQKDDKSYFWVNFTNNEWPRVQITHKLKILNPPQPSLKGGGKNGSPPLELAPHLMRGGVRPAPTRRRRGEGDFTADPIGSFVSGTELKKVLRALRKILPYRTCKNSYEKPCLQWHLGLCPAHTSKSSINPPKAELSSGQPSFLKEGGAVFLQKTARVDLKIYLQSLNTLRQLLRLYAGEPIRIEAYDISNIQGANATGSMIVFEGAKPKKSDYRKFRIKTVHGANDVAMLKEVLRRRFNHPEWPKPDLILIDGGRSQLNSASLAIGNLKLPARHSPEAKPMAGKEISIISLAKRDDELYTIYSNKTLRLRTLPTNLRLNIQAIRNEAHRFAISYYRKLHRKRLKFKHARSKR